MSEEQQATATAEQQEPDNSVVTREQAEDLLASMLDEFKAGPQGIEDENEPQPDPDDLSQTPLPEEEEPPPDPQPESSAELPLDTGQQGAEQPESEPEKEEEQGDDEEALDPAALDAQIAERITAEQEQQGETEESRQEQPAELTAKQVLDPPEEREKYQKNAGKEMEALQNLKAPEFQITDDEFSDALTDPKSFAQTMNKYGETVSKQTAEYLLGHIGNVVAYTVAVQMDQYGAIDRALNDHPELRQFPQAFTSSFTRASNENPNADINTIVAKTVDYVKGELAKAKGINKTGKRVDVRQSKPANMGGQNSARQSPRATAEQPPEDPTMTVLERLASDYGQQ